VVTLSVFDPLQGCAVGLCGAEQDEALARFAADLEWLRQRGVEVRRFSLGHEPGAFAGNPVIKDLIRSQGLACLPVVMVGDDVIAVGRPPRRDELCAKLKVSDNGAARSIAAAT
jgi:arsenical resistance operon trans-acting repressor ArsD